MTLTARPAAPSARARGRGEAAGTSRLARAVLLGSTAALLAGGGYVVLSGRDSGPPAPVQVGDEVRLDGGAFRVDNIRGAENPMGAMPGMGTDADPVPEGSRRVVVEVTLRAAEDEALRYAVNDFRLVVPGGGVPHTPHRQELPGSEVPPGMTRSGTLTYQIPDGSESASLLVDGAPPVELDLPPMGESHHE